MSETKLQECTAQEIFERLNLINWQTEKGHIEMNLAGIKFFIQDKNAIGNLLQEWFSHWMNTEKILFEPGPDNQKFPDFYLNPPSKKEGLLEVKSFNGNTKPAFDVADFPSYIKSLPEHVYVLNKDYLVFAYTLVNGELFIKKIYLKKIWEICGKNPKGVISNQPGTGDYGIKKMRPVTWFSAKFASTVRSRRDFLIILRDTLAIRHKQGMIDAEDWFREVNQSYEAYYRTSIDSP